MASDVCLDDPEIILVLEARRVDGAPRWAFGAARFSDMDLWLEYDGEDLWSSIRGPRNTFYHNADHTFRFYQDRTVPDPVIDADDDRRAGARGNGGRS